MSVSYPARGWLPPGAHFDWQRSDQGRDFVTNWRGIIQAPGDGICITVGSDRPFPNGFGPNYPIVQITSGPFSRGGSPGQSHDFIGQWYIGHCTSLVRPGERFKFGQPLARADQGHNFAGTDGGWVELGTRMSNGQLGPFSSSGHWYDELLRGALVQHETSIVRAKGIFNAALSYNHDAVTVHVHGVPGHVEHWASVEEWIKLEIDVAVGGPHKGSWRGRVIGSSPR